MLPERRPLDPDRHTKEPAMPHQGDRLAASPSRFSHGAISRLGWAALALGLLAPALLDRDAAQAQQSQAPAPTDPASLPDQQLGPRFSVKAEGMPPPRTGPIVSARSLVLLYEGQVPRVPEGFTATPFATGLPHTRRPLVAAT